MSTPAAGSSAVLVRNFLRQDLTLKYRRSLLGFLWSLLNPMLMLAVMTLAFSFLFASGMRGEAAAAQGATGSGGFALHLFACFLPWQCLAACIGLGSRSLIGAERLLMQAPIPIWIFPMRRTLFAVVEYLLSLLALACIIWFVGFVPSTALLILPLSVACLFAFGYGLAAITSVLVVYFRDTEHLITVVLRAWFYLTPVIIPFTAIPDSLLPYFKLNPAFYLMQMFDSPITLAEFPPQETIFMAVGLSVASLVIGMFTLSRFKDEIVFRL
jgi:ABC-type polysaccharide/polyol phosphate export permease